MRKSVLLKPFCLVALPLCLLTSCIKDDYLAQPAPIADQSFIEECDSANAMYNRGWRFINASESKGGGFWQNGGAPAPWFNAYSAVGSNVGFIGADYTSTTAAMAVISNWCISPIISMQNGDKISFYTRAQLISANAAGTDSTDYANRLQVRLTTNNPIINVGSGEDAGDFRDILLDINPNYLSQSTLAPVPNAYPAGWTKFQATISGLNGPVNGRIGFRYFVQDGGSNGRGSGVALDYIEYKSVGH
jgi:hypothetical protein